MKTVTDLGELHRQALAKGGEVEINGHAFNTGRQRVAVAPPAPVEAHKPEPAPEVAPEMITLEEHSRLMSERDALWQGQLEQAHATLQMALAAISSIQSTQPVAIAAPASRWVFDVKYGQDGAIETISATSEG